MELRIKSISDKTFGLTVDGVEYVFPTDFRASSERNLITVKNKSVSFSVNMDYDTVVIDDVPAMDTEAAVDAINQIVFKVGGGVSYTTLKEFEADMDYRSTWAIVHEGAIYVAKADFVSGTAFDESDWDKVSISVKEFEDGLDEKVDKTDDADKMYGTDEHGDQTTFDKSDFEIVGNKITEIRDADHADDVKYPTELAVRRNLNGVFDSIMDDMNTAVGHINEAIGDINGVIGDLSEVAHSTDKSTVVAART
jgi:hypothetical protein